MFGWLRSTEFEFPAHSRLRVLLAIPSLRGGGAERVMTTLARRLTRKRFDVHLVVVQDEGPLGEGLPVDVTRHSLDCSRVSQSALPLLRLIRRLQPDIVLTAASHLNALAGMLRPLFPKRTRLVIRETGVLASSLAIWKAGRMFQPVVAAAYRQADCVIGQSGFALHEIRELFSVPQKRLRRIANPVETEQHASLATTAESSPFPAGPGPHLLCVGRLGPEKGFDRAIQALPALKQSHPDAQLWIVGEGAERGPLRQLANDLGVGESVFLTGYQPDVSRWMAHADLFVLSSRSESLPNVLLEAVASQCPVIALEHPGGTCEVLTSLGLSDRWVSSLTPWKDEWFLRPAAAARTRLIELYHWQQIVAEYEQLFCELAGSAHPVPAAA